MIVNEISHQILTGTITANKYFKCYSRKKVKVIDYAFVNRLASPQLHDLSASVEILAVSQRSQSSLLVEPLGRRSFVTCCILELCS